MGRLHGGKVVDHPPILAHVEACSSCREWVLALMVQLAEARKPKDTRKAVRL